MELIIIIGITILITLALTLFNQNKNKTDKGAQFNYYKLSYRRKFIRTLIMLPFIIIAIVLIYTFIDLSTTLKTIFVILLSLLYLAQIIYNYIMWQKKEAEK